MNSDVSKTTASSTSSSFLPPSLKSKAPRELLQSAHERGDEATHDGVRRMRGSELGGDVRDDSGHVSFVELDSFLSQSVQNWRIKDIPLFLEGRVQEVKDQLEALDTRAGREGEESRRSRVESSP